MSKPREPKYEELEVPVSPLYTDGLDHELGDTTVREIYEDSYGEEDKGWRYDKRVIGGIALAVIVITVEGWRHFYKEHPEEAID